MSLANPAFLPNVKFWSQKWSDLRLLLGPCSVILCMAPRKGGYHFLERKKKKEEKVKDAIHDLVEIRTNAIQCIDFAI